MLFFVVQLPLVLFLPMIFPPTLIPLTCIDTALTCGSVVVLKSFIAVLNLSANVYIPDQMAYSIVSSVRSLISTPNHCFVENVLLSPT